MSHLGTKIVAGAFTLLLCASALLSLAAVARAEPVEMRFDLPPVTVAVSWPAVASVGDNIYVIGGCQGYVVDVPPTLDLVQIYDVKTGDTSIGAPMPKGVCGAAFGTGPDGKVYVAGGWNASDTSYYQKVQIYDPTLNSWTEAAGTVPEPIGRSASAMSADGILYVFGGGWTSNVTLVYNTQTDVWRYGADQPTYGLDAHAVAYNATAVYVIGGSYGSSHSDVRIYNPVADSWSSAAPIPTGGAYGGAVLARNGYIYVFGGSSTGSASDPNPLSSVMRYSVSDDVWEYSTSSLSSGRDHMGVVLDTYGRAVVVGGYSGSAAVANVEAFTTSEIAGRNLIQVSSPQAGSIVSGVVAVQVDKVNGGGTGFPQIDFYVDGTLYETRTWAVSATFLWNTSGLSDGSTHTLMARGYNSDGSVEEASVTVTVSSLSVEEKVAAIEQQLADVQTQLANLRAQLAVQDTNLTALTAQATALQAQITALQAALVAMDTGQTAAMNGLSATLADLQQQLNDMQAQLDKVKTTSDSGSMWGMVDLVLIIVVIVLLVLMLMISRKKT